MKCVDAASTKAVMELDSQKLGLKHGSQIKVWLHCCGARLVERQVVHTSKI